MLSPLLPLLREAQQAGLNLSALLPSHRFSSLFSAQTRSILLLGSAGVSFFDAYQESAITESDPLDSYTKRLVSRLVAAHLPEALAVYFPFEAPFLPFQRMAIEAGLGLPGPLGILISPEYGPWFALRAAVTLPFEVVPPDPPKDVCRSCLAPCIAACPAGAVRREGLQVDACGEARHQGPCAERCVAREACPVGVGWRYQEAAIHFHHRGASLFFPKK